VIQVREYCKECYDWKNFSSKEKCKCDKIYKKVYNKADTRPFYLDKINGEVFASGKLKGYELTKKQARLNYHRSEGVMSMYPNNGIDSLIYEIGFVRLLLVFNQSIMINLKELLPLTISKFSSEIEEHRMFEDSYDIEEALCEYYQAAYDNMDEIKFKMRKKDLDDVRVRSILAEEKCRQEGLYIYCRKQVGDKMQERLKLISVRMKLSK